MTIKFVDTDGELIIPGAYPSYKVAEATGGIATTGVVMLVGEAEFGPAYSEEDIAETGIYGPDSFAQVEAKFGSGPVVDAFKAVVTPSKDAQVSGAPTRIVVAKTNPGGYATAALGSYDTLQDLKGGSLGNLLYTSVSKTAETGPALPAVSFAAQTTFYPGVRVNGGTYNATGVNNTSLLARRAQSEFNTVYMAEGVMMAGGAKVDCVNSLAGVRTLQLAVNSDDITITLSGGAWTTNPSVGDTLEIPGGSSIEGAAAANVGTYIVIEVTNTTIKARKAYTAGAIIAVAPGAVIAGADATFFVHGKVTVKVATPMLSALNRNVISGIAPNVTGAYANGKMTLSSTLAWSNNPKAGDYCFLWDDNNLPSTWVGWYTVDSFTTTTMVLTPMDSVQGALIVGGTYAIASNDDIRCFRPDIDGVSKTLEIWEDDGTSTYFWTMTNGVPVAADWCTVDGTPYMVASTVDPVATINVSRQSTNTFEQLSGGGSTVLKISYTGSNGCTFEWDGTDFTITGIGGAGDGIFVISAAGLQTISDLVSYISSKPGWNCQVGSTLYGQLPVTCLDQGTYDCSAKGTGLTCRVKKDAYDMVKALSNSAVVEFVTGPVTGLPDVQTTTYFSGGSKGATTNTNVTEALEAGEKVRANFVCTLFSRDAADDIADGLTDASSTYDIDSVNAALAAHCSKMSQFKRRRPRQGFASIRGTFLDAKMTAQNLAYARVACAFQDCKNLNAGGVLTQFQPWMTGVIAAGMQAAAFYRPIFNRNLNISGVVQAAGDFFDSNESMVEDALNNGLLTVRKAETGGFRFVSDQTTYGIDNNFVYNSIQAIYAADTVAMTVARRMEDAFVGQSFADVSAAVALGYLKGIMSDLRRVKLITASDDAVEGYRNAQIVINAPAMMVSLEVKLSTGVYFIPIKFLVTQVQQTATA